VIKIKGKKVKVMKEPENITINAFYNNAVIAREARPKQSLSTNAVIARSVATKQSLSQKNAFIVRDCFAALAMTTWGDAIAYQANHTNHTNQRSDNSNNSNIKKIVSNEK
jgi:hypothetical protein